MTVPRLLRRAAVLVAVAAVGPLAAATAPATAGPAICSFVVPCPLDADLPDGDVLGLWTTPNSERVVFLHRGPTGNQLYSVPVRGGEAPTRLDTAAGPPSFLGISPDSSRVLYGKSSATGARQIYSVPVAGPAAASVRLSTDAATVAGAVTISPDSRKVVLVSANRRQLTVVPLAGPASAAARLTDPLVAGGVISDHRISANSSSVVYRANQDLVGATELYRVPLSLSPAPDPATTKLNAPFPAGRAVAGFALAPNDGPVVYLADQDTDNVRELYSVRLGGAGRVKISRPVPTNWIIPSPLEGDSNVRITADGSRVLYRIVQVIFDGQPEVQLLSTPIAGPASGAVRIDRPPTGSAADARLVHFRPTPDGSRVVYTMADDDDGTTAATFYLLSVPVAGPASASAVLSFPRPEHDLFTISPNSGQVTWKLGSVLYGITISSVAHVRLNGPEDAEAYPVLINASGSRVVYEAPTGTTRSLFSAPMSGSGTRYNLTASLGPWDVNQQVLTANGTYVVYGVRRGGLDAPIELFSSRLVP